MPDTNLESCSLVHHKPPHGSVLEPICRCRLVLPFVSHTCGCRALELLPDAATFVSCGHAMDTWTPGQHTDQP